MDDEITIYHNPRCSKSRQTLDLIETAGFAPTIIRYLETPPDAALLRTLLGLLGLGARDLLRRGEDEYAALGLQDENLDENALIAAMVAHPNLIERPIVVRGRRAVLGRPPENVQRLLE